VEEDELNQDFTFKDREEWDSMSHMTLISSLEDEFDIMFDTEDILNYGSFENGINIVRKYGVEI
jgi:acyl carrier protein